MKSSRPARRRRARYAIEGLESRKLLATVPPAFADQAFGAGIDNGTSMAFAPDGRLFALAQTGSVYIIQPNGTTTSALTIPVNNFSERGLLGIAIDPNFSSNGYIYLYYTELPAGQNPLTYSGSTYNRVSRFIVSGNTINPASETLIMRMDQLIAAGNHNAGAMNFGPDGKLYIAVGDNTDGRNSQNLGNRLGKILRINPDGSIPADNPTSFAGIAGSTSGVNRAIWAVGFRNPYSFTITDDGRIFANEVGFNSFEEVNLVQAGRNYGWPNTEGGFDPAVYPDYTNPVYYYGHGGGTQFGFAITGGALYDYTGANAFAPQFQGKYFFCDYGGSWINYIDPATPPSSPSSATNFATGAAGVVGLKLGPDGALYYLQREGTPGVRRIAYAASVAPYITRQPEEATVAVGESATFSVEASGTGPLTYTWQRNAVDIPNSNSPTYTIPAVSNADHSSAWRVIVRNALGSATSQFVTLLVNSNAAPVPVISTPASSSLFNAGQTISFSGSATDREDGTLASSRLSWTIVFHHDTHTHPFIGPLNGVGSGTFVVPDIGEPSANIWYRIHLTATDSAGRSATVTRDILPRTSVFTLNTLGTPAGATLNLDAQPLPSGTTTIGVVGMQRVIDAPATQVLFGQTYEFVSWSDGGSRTHAITAPAANAIFTATYRQVVATVNRVAGKVSTVVGTPVAGSRIYLDANFNSRFDAGELFTTSDASGNYELQPPGLGTVHLLVDGANYTPGDGYWYSISELGDERTFNFTLNESAVDNTAVGTVTTSSGTPAANVRVYLDENLNNRFDTGERVTTTNATGAYSLQFPGTGMMHVSIDGSDFVPAIGYWYGIATAGDRRTMNFTVAGVQSYAHRVSGRVVSSAGPAIASARVYLDVNFNSTFDAGESFALTDAAGNYAIPFNATGTVHVMCDLANVTPAAGYWYSVGTAPDERTADFSVSSGPLLNRASGRVISAAGAAAPGIQVFLDANLNSRLDGGELTTTTSTLGEYVLSYPGTGMMHLMLVNPAYVPLPGYWYGIAVVGDDRTMNFTLSSTSGLTPLTPAIRGVVKKRTTAVLTEIA